jgi:predicted ester cyclase
MPEQDLLSIAKGVVDAFNASDWERIRDIAGNGVYREVGTRRRLEGGDEIVGALQVWKNAMPDVSGTVTNGFTSGNQVALEVTWTGTQTAPLEPGGYIRKIGGGIPASGQRHTNAAAWIFEFDGIKLKESRQYFDMATFIPSAAA